MIKISLSYALAKNFELVKVIRVEELKTFSVVLA